jgi:hypothetical protein
MAVSGTIALVTENPQLGQNCVFNVTTDGLKGKRFPRVYVESKQNGVVVYGEIRELDGGEPHPTDGPCTFAPLGAGSSDWLNDTPPADAHSGASCIARLFYHDQHDAQITLAEIAFEATGL